MIEVRFQLRDCCKDPQLWETALRKAMLDAGVPAAIDGTLSAQGSLQRFYSWDWNEVIYRWIPSEDLPRRLTPVRGAEMKRFYIGKEPCCGAVFAAMVDNERTTAKDVAEFARSIAKTRGTFKHLELLDDDQVTLERCKCKASPNLTVGLYRSSGGSI